MQDICAVSADLARYYAQQECAQRQDDDRAERVVEVARNLVEESPYDVFVDADGLDAVEAINKLAKAKTSLDLFEAQQMLIECITTQAKAIAERTTP